jgi:hypothetical protein
MFLECLHCGVAVVVWECHGREAQLLWLEIVVLGTGGAERAGIVLDNLCRCERRRSLNMSWTVTRIALER